MEIELHQTRDDAAHIEGQQHHAIGQDRQGDW
jgi:hypothetical protein